MGDRNRQRLLWAAATDRTFHLADLGGRRVLLGKCIHCNTKLWVALDGQAGPGTTLEHILPRTHGGGHDDANTAVACSRCNGQKGRKLDTRHLGDPTLQRVITTLRARREERRRPPLPDLGLTGPPDEPVPP
jgi:5-methylcytosine-specific restriction endonuclease McrA